MTLASNGINPFTKIYTWTYADATARGAASGFTADDVNSLALQLDDASLWLLADDSPVTWVRVGGSAVAALDDIGDVNAPAPSDGDVLTWDATPGEWVPAAPSAGSSGPAGRLGSATATSDQATSSATIGDITGLSVSVTVGSRRVKITFSWVDVTHTVAGGYSSLEIWDDTAGARIAQAVVIAPAAAGGGNIGPGGALVVEHNPGAGARTYKARFKVITAGTLTLEANATAPLTLLVEEI